MNWQIHGLNIHLTPALETYAQLKIQHPLDRYTESITGITLRVRDEDLRKTKAEINTLAIITLNSGAVLRLEQRDSDYYAAVDQLADRIRRAVKRHLGRRRDLRRRKHQRAVA